MHWICCENPRSGLDFDRLPGVDTIVLDLAVERRATDSETACNLAHLSRIELQREADDLFLDLVEGAQLTVIADRIDHAAGSTARLCRCPEVAERQAAHNPLLAFGKTTLQRDVRHGE